jgi:hypothetical protein
MFTRRMGCTAANANTLRFTTIANGPIAYGLI